ncbi:MAG TPA: alpha-galactosidase [Gemmatimonadales bacterium]|nr:alpha-galactosidase [Gemmatimonadales bacterium]
MDDQRRWSLSYLGEGPPVPLVRDAILGAWIADQFIALGDLEYTSAGTERPAGGEALRIRGNAAGVSLEATFFTSLEAPVPIATVSLSVFPDRVLPTVKGVRFFQATASEVLPAVDPLVALIEARESSDAPQVITLPLGASSPALASYGVLGLTRGSRGLALAFDATDSGVGVVQVAGENLAVVSDWMPGRPLPPAGDTSRLHVCYDPEGNGLTALRALLVPSSPADRARMLGAPAPASWSTRGLVPATVTESDVLANADICATRFDRRFCRLITVGDGYQRALGDWDTNDRFPHGHRSLTDQLHSRGFQVGLWIAPLAVSPTSALASAHPDWLAKASGDGTEAIRALDPAQPAVREWLAALARRAVQEWGYDALLLDFLGGSGGSPEAYRLGLASLRDGAGTETVLHGAGAPLQPSVGFVNAMRVVPDVQGDPVDVEPAARALAVRSFYHRGTWLNAPGPLLVGPPLERSEAQLWASIIAVSGTVVEYADDLRSLPADRLDLIARTLPPAAPGGRPIDVMTDDPGVAPALVARDGVHAISGPWHLRTGDDARFAARDYDERVWETVPVPAPWGATGHAGYSGYAWYRTRFDLPEGQADPAPAQLELGRVDSADETFLNGVRIGGTGAFPPVVRLARDTFRRYLVPPDLPNWGGENVLAVRVYAGGAGGAGGGGIWSVRRERPPRVWVTEGAPRWWTVVLANWESNPADVVVPLTSLAIAGTRFDVYDVWGNVALPAVTDVIRASLAPRSATTIALRAAAQRPQVIGTTRHVVQGAIDIADESWEAGARTLRCRAANLDSRAYGITIAVPPELKPVACTARTGGASVACVIRRLESGHAVVEWAAGAASGEVEWAATFEASAPPPPPPTPAPSPKARRKPTRP